MSESHGRNTQSSLQVKRAGTSLLPVFTLKMAFGSTFFILNSVAGLLSEKKWNIQKDTSVQFYNVCIS